ncbi:hypothetical protein BH09BAC6_BH09BAC6_15360 [soil metagenome]|jgi:hypothetical protein
MRPFLKTLLYFCSVFLGLLLIGFFAPPTPNVLKSLIFAQIDKDALLVSTPSPRLILVGGSNLSFGINSQLLHDSLKLNPVNTAIEASVGLKYMLDHSKSFVKKGDVVIVSPEYHQYFGNYMYGGDDLLRTVMDVSRRNYKLLSVKQWLNISPGIMSYACSKFNPNNYFPDKKQPNMIVYKRNSFNEFGDVDAHWSQKTKRVPPISGFRGAFNTDAIAELNKFRSEIQQKGATLLVTYPAIQPRSYKNNIAQLNQVQLALCNAGFRTLGTPGRYVLPDSLFYNTFYHLIKQGVDERTRLLIHNIQYNLRLNAMP